MARRTPEEAEETRLTLLQVALQEYAAVGIHNTSLKAIAAKAGVTHGALYWHFKSRDDLILALCESQTLPVESYYLDQLQAIDQDPLAALRKFLVDTIVNTASNQQAFQVYKLFYGRRCELPINEQLQALLDAQWQLWESYINKFLKQARKQKLVVKKTKNLPLATLLLTHALGLLDRQSSLLTPVEFAKLVNLSISTSIKGIESID